MSTPANIEPISESGLRAIERMQAAAARLAQVAPDLELMAFGKTGNMVTLAKDIANIEIPPVLPDSQFAAKPS